MDMADTSLNRESWITAALEVLLDEGPDAVAVQPLARLIGATKGSFYWHFTGRDDLLRATLERWEDVSTSDVIAKLDGLEGTPADKMRALFAFVTAHSERSPGELRMLAAIEHPDIAAAVERSTRRRLDYLAALFRAHGLPAGAARRRAVLAYTTYLGHAQLMHSTPGLMPSTAAARRRLLDEMSAMFLDAVPS
jgi:AcrR family transcriptional regulator